MRSQPAGWFAVLLAVSLGLNGVLAGLAWFGKSMPAAEGQSVNSGNGFIMATEQLPDQTPVCFVLDTRKAHLALYKTDISGQLLLTGIREIRYDMLLPDHHFPKGQIPPGGYLSTLPPVREVEKAVRKLIEKKDKDEAKEKTEEKKS
ncbi:MAG: hypothetical protein HY717_24540 [Planctomycetes bacterium]|nr:hypothetical protein [Planctomycetota bacterium]